MRNNLNQLAWIILITSFGVFCLLIIGIPLAIRSHIHNATVGLPAYVEAISGTVLVQDPDSPEPVGVSLTDPSMPSRSRTRELKAGSSVTTDNASRALLTFLPNSHQSEEAVLSTVQLYHNTLVSIEESHAPRYASSPNPPRLTIKVMTGQMRIALTKLNESEPHVEVFTPHSRVQLREGSYSFRVANDVTEVLVRYGEAFVTAGGESITLSGGQRSEVGVGDTPAPPMPAAQNLLVNGNFAKPLDPSWELTTFEASPEAVPGKAEIVTTGGRKAVFFSRMGQDGIHTEVDISQVINRDVLDFESLVLRFDIKLLYQSLSGGGYLSSEFPLMVRLDYKDVYGIDRFWARGFYYQNVDNYPILSDVWGQPFGEQIPHAIWYPYESPNLMETLGDIRPARIHAIRIYASGWNFQSMVTEVGLIAE